LWLREAYFFRAPPWVTGRRGFLQGLQNRLG
jgi:hypothetical protein